LTTGQSVPLNQFWKVLPAQSRRQVLVTLSRIVAEHLPKPQTRREVNHDRY
jgi:hypothetical protein